MIKIIDTKTVSDFTVFTREDEKKNEQIEKIVEEIILFLPTRFKVSIENYVIMPDHIHLLLEINDYDRAIRESPLQSRSILSSCIGFLKADATKKLGKLILI